MARIKMYNNREYALMFEKLAKESLQTCDAVLEVGAGVLTTAVRQSIESLPVDDAPWKNKGEKRKMSTITSEEKAGLLESLGYTPPREEKGVIERHIGFDGYNSKKTKKYPKGQPNQMIARSIESGSTFRQKTPFVRQAINGAKKAAIEAMQEKFNEILKERT